MLRERAATDSATIADQTTKIFRHMKGLHATYLIHLGVELGFFKRMAEAGSDGLTGDELANKCGTVPRYTKIWCQTATALELVDAVGTGRQATRSPGTRYRLAPHIDELLANEGGSFYVGGSPEVHLQIARDYARFPDFFRNGQTRPYQAHDRPFLLAATRGPKPQPRIFIKMVLPKFPDLRRRLERGGRVLDLGCGGGHALVEFAKSFPKAECVGVDIQPDVLAAARRLVARNGLRKRVATHLVKLDDDYAGMGRFDLVTLFLVLHEISPEIKQKVIDRAAEALAAGGYLLVFDEAYPETLDRLRSEPEVFGVMAQWYEGTWGNIINTRHEIRKIVSSAGLRIADEAEFSRYLIVTAKKP